MYVLHIAKPFHFFLTSLLFNSFPEEYTVMMDESMVSTWFFRAEVSSEGMLGGLTHIGSGGALFQHLLVAKGDEHGDASPLAFTAEGELPHARLFAQCSMPLMHMPQSRFSGPGPISSSGKFVFSVSAEPQYELPLALVAKASLQRSRLNSIPTDPDAMGSEKEPQPSPYHSVQGIIGSFFNPNMRGRADSNAGSSASGNFFPSALFSDSQKEPASGKGPTRRESLQSMFSDIAIVPEPVNMSGENGTDDIRSRRPSSISPPPATTARPRQSVRLSRHQSDLTHDMLTLKKEKMQGLNGGNAAAGAAGHGTSRVRGSSDGIVTIGESSTQHAAEHDVSSSHDTQSNDPEKHIATGLGAKTVTLPSLETTHTHLIAQSVGTANTGIEGSPVAALGSPAEAIIAQRQNSYNSPNRSPFQFDTEKDKGYGKTGAKTTDVISEPGPESSASVINALALKSQETDSPKGAAPTLPMQREQKALTPTAPASVSASSLQELGKSPATGPSPVRLHNSGKSTGGTSEQDSAAGPKPVEKRVTTPTSAAVKKDKTENDFDVVVAISPRSKLPQQLAIPVPVAPKAAAAVDISMSVKAGRRSSESENSETMSTRLPAFLHFVLGRSTAQGIFTAQQVDMLCTM